MLVDGFDVLMRWDISVVEGSLKFESEWEKEGRKTGVSRVHVE